MKQFIQDLAMMPEFYRGKRQGKIWLEPREHGIKKCRCQAGSNTLSRASAAYTRLQGLLDSYLHILLVLLVSGGAMVIIQQAHI